MKFKQTKAGFMKKFEGCWRVEPLFVDEAMCHPFKPVTKEDYYACARGKGRIGSKVSLEQTLQPSIVPPPPLSWYLRGITARTTEMLINDMLAETARIRGGYEAENLVKMWTWFLTQVTLKKDGNCVEKMQSIVIEDC